MGAADPQSPAGVGRKRKDAVLQELGALPDMFDAAIGAHQIEPSLGADPEAPARRVGDRAHTHVAQAPGWGANLDEPIGRWVITGQAAAAHADPEAPLGIDMQGLHRAVRQTARRGPGGVRQIEAEVVSIPARQPVLGADPEKPRAILRHGHRYCGVGQGLIHRDAAQRKVGKGTPAVRSGAEGRTGRHDTDQARNYGATDGLAETA